MRKYIDAEKLKLKVNHEMDMQDTYLPAHFFDIVDDMPAADVQEVRRGRWLRTYHNKQYKKCSVCESVFSVNLPKNANYCPNCGADMRGE